MAELTVKGLSAKHPSQQRFLHHPERYLPHTDQYKKVNSIYINQLLHRPTMPAASLSNTTTALNGTAPAGSIINGTATVLHRRPLNLNSTDTQILAIVSVIQGFLGASIPTVPQAIALVQSAGPLIETDVGSALNGLVSSIKGIDDCSVS